MDGQFYSDKDFAVIDNARTAHEERLEAIRRSKGGWAAPLPMLHAIDPGFSGTEDEDTLVVWHDGELVARYSRHASVVSLIADARQHMAEKHGVALPYSVRAVAGGV